MTNYLNLDKKPRIMEVKTVIEKLESDSEFKAWKEKNKNTFLAHIFRMIDEANKDIWQIGYYNEKTDKITTFLVEETGGEYNITIGPESEVFKKEETRINPLDLKKVKVDITEAMHNAQEFQKEKYKGSGPAKVIVILQNLKSGLVYNITFITQTFDTLNMKVSADTGKIVKHKLINMMQFSGKAG